MPFLHLLLQQLAAHQPDDGDVVGDDTDAVSAEFDGPLRIAHLSHEQVVLQIMRQCSCGTGNKGMPARRHGRLPSWALLLGTACAASRISAACGL